MYKYNLTGNINDKHKFERNGIMYFIKYITLAVISTILFTTAVDAKALDSLTKEQKETYLSLQDKYQNFTQSHQDDFNTATTLKQKFITDHQTQFDSIIVLEKQFKAENKENIEKLSKAREKFKENHPNAILGPKDFLFKDEGSTEEKYQIIYKKLETMSQKHTNHSHFKIKTDLQKKFFNNNKETILNLKSAHEKFIQEHNDEFKLIQDDYQNFYNENKNIFDTVSTLKLQFLEDNKNEIEKLGSAAPMFFHEIGVNKKFKY